jgi:hypothetical protein
MVVQFCEYTRNQQTLKNTVHSGQVDFMVHKLYLHKAIKTVGNTMVLQKYYSSP